MPKFTIESEVTITMRTIVDAKDFKLALEEAMEKLAFSSGDPSEGWTPAEGARPKHDNVLLIEIEGDPKFSEFLRKMNEIKKRERGTGHGHS